MKLDELRNARFLGQIRECIIFNAGMDTWFLAFQMTGKTGISTPDLNDYVKMTKPNGELRIFKSLKSANFTAWEICSSSVSHLLDESQKINPSIRIFN